MRLTSRKAFWTFVVAATVLVGAAVATTYFTLSFIGVSSRDYRLLSQDLHLIHELQLTIQRSLMPPHDHLIRPDPRQKARFQRVLERAASLLDNLEALHEQEGLVSARSPGELEAYLLKDLAAIQETRLRLKELKKVGFELLDMEPGPGTAELMVRFDGLADELTDRLQSLISLHLSEMASSWQSLEDAHGRATRVFLASAVLAGVAGLVLLGLLIAHAYLLQQSLARRDQLKALYEAAKQITSLRDRERLLPWIANTASRLVASEAAGVYLLDKGSLTVGGWTDQSPEAFYQKLSLDTASPWRKIIHTNSPHLSRDIATDPIWPDPLRQAALQSGFHSFLGVPLRVKDQALGVLTVFRCQREGFEPEEVELLSAFADQAAVALENARLIEHLQSTQDQLLQSEKMASLGQFIAGMAHEVGTPLTIISGNAEYLLEVMGDSANGREELQAIIQQTERITALLKQLLDFSRPQRSTAQEPIQINDLITQTLGLLGPQATKSSIEITTSLRGDIPLVEGIADHLQQVLVNVIINAFHAMPEGGKLTISSQSGPRQRRLGTQPEWVEITIQDTGEGIAPSDLKKIFDPFFSTKPSGEGTGLGLYVSYQIVKNHGGEIQVESKLGRGTTVTILLPAAVSHEEDFMEEIPLREAPPQPSDFHAPLAPPTGDS
jgi:signal transduction histidine kinase